MVFPSRGGRYIQRLVHSTNRPAPSLRQPDLTISSLSRPTAYNRHGSMLFLTCNGLRSESTDSNPPQPNPGPSSQPGPADSPTRMIIPNPFPDDATFEAVRQHFHRSMAENANDPELQAVMRLGAFEGALGWLLDNFPEKDGFVYCPLGEFPRDIQYVDTTKGEGQDGATVAIPQDDTRLYLMGRRRAEHEDARVDGKKQRGLACVALCALPPAGVGEGGMAGTPLAQGTDGTAAMDAAEKALLGLVRELQDVGYQGQAPMGEAVDGCVAVVFMGVDMLIYEYSKQRGFFDPPGGFEFEEKRVDAEPLPWPPLPGAESEQK